MVVVEKRRYRSNYLITFVNFYGENNDIKKYRKSSEEINSYCKDAVKEGELISLDEKFNHPKKSNSYDSLEDLTHDYPNLGNQIKEEYGEEIEYASVMEVIVNGSYQGNNDITDKLAGLGLIYDLTFG